MTGPFLDCSALAAVLAEFSYLPGWEMAVRPALEGPTLYVNATVVDAYHPDGPPVPLHIVSLIPPARCEEQFVDWLDWRLYRVAVHEHYEWLRRNGRPLHDPGHGAEVTRRG